MTFSATSGSARGRGLVGWLPLIIPGVLVFGVMMWWAFGFSSPWQPQASGFSEHEITCDLVDVPLATAIAILRPGSVVRYKSVDAERTLLTLKVDEMKERYAWDFIARLFELRIETHGEVIVVRGKPLLERSYDASSAWMRKHFETRLWPDR